MYFNFIVILLIVLVIIYLYNFIKKEEFGGINNNIYESIGLVPNKLLYLTPPNSKQPDIDYQDYLNNISGYDGATRSYNNQYYAQAVASGLDTN